jgi:hypothetical protein
MTVNDAVEGAMNADILHLACHGHQDQNSPLDSGFDLKDGRLKLNKLMRMNMPNAQLAYLSACESAGVDGSRPDEGLNLAGGMIFAGFKSVIATLWWEYQWPIDGKIGLTDLTGQWTTSMVRSWPSAYTSVFFRMVLST